MSIAQRYDEFSHRITRLQSDLATLREDAQSGLPTSGPEDMAGYEMMLDVRAAIGAADRLLQQARDSIQHRLQEIGDDASAMLPVPATPEQIQEWYDRR